MIAEFGFHGSFLEVIFEQPDLFIGEVLRQRIRFLQAGDVQQRLRHRIAFILEELQKPMQIVQFRVHSPRWMAFVQALVQIVLDEGAFEISQLGHLSFLTEEAPEAQMVAPKAAYVFLQAAGTPVALLHPLEAFQLAHQPGRQPLRVLDDIEWLGFVQFPQSSFQPQETPEAFQPIPAGLLPVHACLFPTDILQGSLQVLVEVELLMRLQVQPQGMPGNGYIDRVGRVLAGAAFDQPGAKANKQLDILFGPVPGGPGAWGILRQELVSRIEPGLIVFLGHGDSGLPGRAHQDHPSILGQAA